MFCKFTLIVIILMTILRDTDGKHSSITVSGKKITIYRLNSHNPFSKLGKARTNIPANIQELILSLPYEIETPKVDYSWARDIVPSKANERKRRNVCKINNGNCSQTCEDVDGEAICSCHLGLSLAGHGDCIKPTRRETILSGTSGNFTTDTKDYSWIIKAPDQHSIRCIITVLLPEHSKLSPNGMFYYLSVYDGYSQNNKISADDQDSTTRGWTSSGPYMHIRINSFEEVDVRFRISYQTGASHLVLRSSNGDFRISSITRHTCYSLTYSLPHNGNLYVNYYREASFKGSFEGKVTKIFQFRSGTDSVHFKFSGKNSRVYSFRKCTDIEKLWAGSTEAHEDRLYVGHSTSDGFVSKCLNGGTWNNATHQCVCPVGFIGTYCEEGCGPNRFGENCTAVCSVFSSNCGGMIFCTEEMCSCAPGFHGINCNNPCQEGSYGVLCRLRCGNCTDGESCDRFTGKCSSGCENGFYPPLCQQTYKMLRDKPDITEIGYTHVVLNLSFQNVSGAGEPTFYEVQYKMLQDDSWSKLAPRLISDEKKFNVTGLLAGKQYHIRIILVDKDGGRYEKDLPQAIVMTKCTEPVQANYYVGAMFANSTAICLEWSYAPKKNSLECEIKKFELSFFAGNDEFIVPVAQLKGTEIINGLLPDTDYSFQLIGETVTGESVVPSKITVHTSPTAPGRVRDVQVMVSDVLHTITISWSDPWNYAGRPLRYIVTYKCEKLFACGKLSCASFSGQKGVHSNMVVLEQNIRPHAKYQIKIVAIDLNNVTGEAFTTYVTTSYSAPQVTPAAAENPIRSVTNVSASVNWIPPTDCTKVNGYLYGYSYTLMDTETNRTLDQGTVRENTLFVTFSDLQPRHCYKAYIAIVTSGVTEFRDFLVIPFCTKSAAPDKVQSLKVYKRGRRMVGLRWGLPLNTYGDIVSYTVTYGKVGSGAKKTILVQPKECVPWPNFYCHTISQLSPGKKYRFMVRARNKETHTDGVPASVETVTTEGESTPPKNLKILNATEDSVLLRWEIPDIINGQLRSFIIVTEQIDTRDLSDECCDDIPLDEYHVTSEERFYTYKMTGLSSASTYSVTVAAKTVSLSELARITVHTLPPKPKLPENALTLVGEECGTECDTVSFRIHPAEHVNGVNRTYMLLLLSNSSRPVDTPDDIDIESQVRSEFGNSYHIVSEYTEDEIEEQKIITFGKRDLGIENEDLQSLQFALVLVQEYMGKHSMDFFVTEHN